MTVAEATPATAYTGDGTEDTFAVGFTFAAAGDLVVTIDGAATEAFTVEGDEIVFDDPPADDAAIAIMRRTTANQGRAFASAETVKPLTIEQALDHLTRLVQEVREGNDRAVTLPVGEGGFQLPAAGARLNMVLAFDAAGLPVLLPAASIDLQSALASMVTVQPSWSGAVTRSLLDRLMATVQIDDFIPAAELAGIRAGTSNYNCDTAFTNAKAAVGLGGGAIDFGAGTYKFAAGLSWNDRRITIRGKGDGNQPGVGTRLLFPAGVTGITMQNGPAGKGACSSVEDCRIVGQDVALGTNDGIRVQANRGRVIRVTVEAFGRHGIYVLSHLSEADVTINANTTLTDSCRSINNFGDGWRAEGVDSNAGETRGLDVSGNGGWGIHEKSFLGNVHTAPHAAANTAGSYRLGAPTRNVRIIGAYHEEVSGICLQVDAGGGGNNIIELGETGADTITNNDDSGIGTVIWQKFGTQHVNQFQVGGRTDSYIRLQEEVASNMANLLLARGAQLNFLEEDGSFAATNVWSMQATGGNMSISREVGTGALYLVAPLSIGAGGTPITRVLHNSVAWDPPNLADAAQQTHNIACDGAAVGDPVFVGFTQDLQGTQLTGYVSAADVVTLVHRNGTGGAVNLASGVARAVVFKL